jgi:8-oxo-dGTP pyrophosphatase MutT (NUDIX family)
MAFIRDHMIIDPSLQADIIARVIAGDFGDEPAQAVNALGRVTLPDGKTVNLFARHAADPVILDAFGQVVLVTRRHNPGAGKLALPGGFIDEVDGKPEAGMAAAMREAMEETGISPETLAGARKFVVGPRIFDRKFDIRSAWNNLPGTRIMPQDIFTVSTRGYGFFLSGDLLKETLVAGDDAGAVSVVKIASLMREDLSAPDHLAMITAASAMVRGWV